MKNIVSALALVAGLGCGLLDSDSGATLSIAFRVSDGSGAAPGAAGAAGAAASPGVSLAANALTLEGGNGTLVIEQIRLVVDEFKLEREGETCDDLPDDDDGCEEFEAPPHFVSVPLDGEAAGEVSEAVPAGTYEELKFETKAPRGDAEGTALLAAIREEFPDWPEEASALITGTFTPAGGEGRPFRVYLDAEVKVELEFDTPLVVAEEGGDLTVTVFVNPAIWFMNADGSVTDLSAFDFDDTGEVFEFEAKFRDGFTKIELD